MSYSTGGNYNYPDDMRSREDWNSGYGRSRSLSPNGKKKTKVQAPKINRFEVATMNRPFGGWDDSQLRYGGQGQQFAPQQQFVPQQQQQQARSVFLGPVPGASLANTPVGSNLAPSASGFGTNPPGLMNRGAPMQGLNTYYSYLAQPQTGNPLIDMIVGTASGKIPSNELVHEIGDITREVLEGLRYDASLTKTNQKTARHLEAVIESFQKLLVAKNADEKWQKFIIDSNLVAQHFAQQAKQQPINREQAAQARLQAKDLNETAQGTVQLFVNVLKTLISSHQFRSLLLDTVKLFEDIATQEQEAKKQGGGFQQSGMGFGQGQGQGPSGYPGQGAPMMGQQMPMGGYSTVYGAPFPHQQSTQFYGSSPIYGPSSFGPQPNMYNMGPQYMGQQPNFQDERKRELAQRMRLLLERLAENQDFIDALRGIFILIENVKQIQSQSFSSFDPSKDPLVQVMWNDAKMILYTFVGQKALDGFLDHSWGLINDIRKDQQSTLLFQNLRDFIMRSLENPTLIRDREHVRQSEELIVRIRQWSQQAQYKDRLNLIYGDLRLMLEMLKTDRDSLRLMKDIRALGADIFMDPVTGKADLASTRQSLFQFKDILIPLILRHLEVIHIPLISGENPGMQWAIEDLIVHGTDILPDHVHIRSATEGDMHFQKKKRGGFKTFIYMDIKHFALHAHRFKFYYKKLTGLKLEDQGLADFDVAGHGNMLSLVWKVKSKDGVLKFSVKDVICHIDKVKIRIIQARHAILDKLAIALMKGSIKKKLQRSLTEGAYGWMNGLNTRLNSAFIPADRSVGKKWKYEKGAYGIPETVGATQSESYVHTDPYTTRFGRQSVTY